MHFAVKFYIFFYDGYKTDLNRFFDLKINRKCCCPTYKLKIVQITNIYQAFRPFSFLEEQLPPPPPPPALPIPFHAHAPL